MFKIPEVHCSDYCVPLGQLDRLLHEAQNIECTWPFSTLCTCGGGQHGLVHGVTSCVVTVEHPASDVSAWLCLGCVRCRPPRAPVLQNLRVGLHRACARGAYIL